MDKLDHDGFRADVSKVLLAVGQAGVTQVLFDRVPRAAGEVQILLTRLVGDIGNPAGGPIFLDLLDPDQPPQLQGRLIEALGKLRYEPAVASLLVALRSSDPWVRRRAVLALVGHEVTVLKTPLATAFADPDPGVRHAAVTVAGLTGHRDLLDSIAEQVADPAETVRTEVGLALGLAREPASGPALLTLASDPRPSVRAAAAMGLAFLDDPELVTKLNELSRDAALRRSSHAIFVSDSPNPLVARVVEEAEDEGSVETRFFMGVSPVAIEKEMAERALTALDVEERMRALEVCESVATGHAYVSALSILMHDPSPEVRGRGLRTVVKCRKDAEVAGLVGRVLDDPHPARHLQDDEAEVRAASVGALAKYRLGIVARHLRDSLSDPNNRVRAAAVNALSRLRTPEWEARIEAMLHDPDEFVRQRAAIGLVRMGRIPSSSASTPSIGSPPSCVRDPDPEVRSEAEQALRLLDSVFDRAHRNPPDPSGALGAKPRPIPAWKVGRFGSQTVAARVCSVSPDYPYLAGGALMSFPVSISPSSILSLALSALLASLSATPDAHAGGAVETYTVVFDATWSADNHPADFPSNPHFSGLVGGTHGGAVSFWAPGELATEGIRRMAELGAKNTLMDEVQLAIDTGTADAVLCGPGIGNSPGTASMTVDVHEDFSRITLVSMVAPSPDWFIGVSGIDLQDSGGNWQDLVVVDLRAWDAGTDSGTTYTSGNDPTDPREVISDITDGYPFFGVTLGTLRFARQSVSVGDPASSALSLSPARPNPARARSVVTLSLSDSSPVIADVFDVTGRRVHRLADRVFTAGNHAVVWDGRTDDARSPAGVYFFRVSVGGDVRTSRVTWIR